MITQPDEQKLPSALSDDELDAVIMAQVTKHWAKVARIVGDVRVASGMKFEEETLVARIKALAEAGKLETAGDVSNTRFSEVRLL